nr:MAG: internal scaffolding protein [Microvirus sp.]
MTKTKSESPTRPFKRHFANTTSDRGADQSHAAETNINNIVAQFQTDGVSPMVNPKDPLYGDFTAPMDLQSAITRSTDAREAFAALPAHVRAAADNDPVEFLAMVEDPEGMTILKKAGLEFLPDVIADLEKEFPERKPEEKTEEKPPGKKHAKTDPPKDAETDKPSE